MSTVIVHCPKHPEMVIDSPNYGPVQCPRCRSARYAARHRREGLARDALQAVIIADAINHTVPATVGPMSAAAAAKEAVAYADALIAELDGQPESEPST